MIGNAINNVFERSIGRSVISVAGHRFGLSTWQEPSHLGTRSQDCCGWTVFEDPEWTQANFVLRLVVCDGVTPVADRTPEIDGLDGAAWSARCATRTILKGLSPVHAALHASAVINRRTASLDPQGHLTSRQRPQTMAYICDLGFFDDGIRLTFLDCGDCEARLRVDDNWVDPTPGGGYSSSRMVDLVEYKTAYPTDDLFESQTIEDMFFSTPDDFQTTPLGRFTAHDDHKFNLVEWPDIFDSPASIGVLVFSDGIRQPDDFDFDNTRERLEYLGLPETDTSHFNQTKARDDITVLSLGELAPRFRSHESGVMS